MRKMADSGYIHGTSAEEQSRLARLNALLNRASLEALGLAGGERILDVGSGLGQLTRAMGKATGRCVIGVERSADQRETAERLAAEGGEKDFAEFRAGDAEALPLARSEWGTFDLVHARFVLEHVADPLAVVRQMTRAVRPGGRIVLEDDDHSMMRLWPTPEGFSAVWSAYMASYEKIGGDPIVGRRLVALLAEAGAHPRRNRLLFFGSCAGAADFPLYTENLSIILEQARGLIVDGGLLDAERFDRARAAYREWADRPDAAIWYVRNWAEGLRR
ncbi:MAG TPA: methyltransferase domain-containing protein [Thermoanaerobaculia bacterium]|nr:methyltransferase domain-containing protein [Thermoanaerobaculia bacterium]